MTRSQMGALVGLLSIALSTGSVAAQTVTPTPTSTPTPIPMGTPIPVATPIPAPTPASATASQRWKPGHGPEYFLVGDYVWGTYSKNQFNPVGNNNHNTFAGRGAVEYPFGKLAVMAEGTYDHFQYFHPAGPVASIGGGQTFVPSFFAHNVDWDGRVGIGLPYPRVFVVASYGQRRNNYGYPNLQGFGVGLEKLPDFNEKTYSFFGSYLYYPKYGGGNTLQYGMYKYQAGVEFHLNNARHVPAFVEVGVLGDYAYAKKKAPTFLQDQGFFGGVGVHF